MQYQDNDKFVMPWGKHQGKTVAEVVKIDRQYAEYISKPDAVKARIVQELETPTISDEQPQEPGGAPF